MPSISQSRRIFNVVNDLHEAATLDGLGEAFRRGVAPLVPGDLHEIFVFGSGAPEDDVWLGSPGGYTPEERAELLAYIDQTPEQHPILEHHGLNGPTGPRRVSEFLSVRAWRRREFYELFNRRWRHDYEVAALLEGAAPSGIAGMTVVRSATDITNAEIDVLRQLQRPLAAALRRLLEERRRRRALQDLRVTSAQITAVCPLLTRREAEVMSLLAEGKSDAEIGRALGMSHLTAGTHVANILRKLGAENRLNAALHVIRRIIATA